MLMSSSVVPVHDSNLSSQETANEVKRTGTERNSKQFEDSSGDLPEDAIKEDGNTINSQIENKSAAQDDQNENTIETGITAEGNKEDKVETESADMKIESKNLEENQDEKTESQEEPKEKAENGGDEKKEDVTGQMQAEGGEVNKSEQTESEAASSENKSDSDEGNKNLAMGDSSEENRQDEKDGNQVEQSASEDNKESQEKSQTSVEVFPTGSLSEILNETDAQTGAWSTQAVESQNEKKSQQSSISKDPFAYGWKLCNATAGPDYIPCLDNWQTIRRLPSTKHYEHRERHCPEEAPTCLVPVPEGYRRSVKWPKSREKVNPYSLRQCKFPGSLWLK